MNTLSLKDLNLRYATERALMHAVDLVVLTGLMIKFNKYALIVFIVWIIGGALVCNLNAKFPVNRNRVCFEDRGFSKNIARLSLRGLIKYTIVFMFVFKLLLNSYILGFFVIYLVINIILVSFRQTTIHDLIIGTYVGLEPKRISNKDVKALNIKQEPKIGLSKQRAKIKDILASEDVRHER